MLCNSWIIVSKETGQAIAETCLPAVVAAVNRDRYDVLTAYDYLVRLNTQLREARAKKAE